MKFTVKRTVLSVLLLLLVTLSTKAENRRAFHPDSVPQYIQNLEKYYLVPKEYLQHWNGLMAKANATGSQEDKYFLYKDRNFFHYTNGEVDSVRKYTTIVKNLSQQYQDSHAYYYNWLLLCETYSNMGDGNACTRENEAMYKEAIANKNEIGMAYYLFAMTTGYLTSRQYQKAEPYLVQAMQKFYQMKRWDIYVVLASNHVILLSELKREKESVAAFYKLDSLANQALQGKVPGLSPRSIAMIKYQAIIKCAQNLDTKIFNKYLKEIEDIYKIYPSIPKLYLYGSKQTDAYLKKDYITQAAYIDSTANYYKERNSKENVRRMYVNGAQALAMANKYKEAFNKMVEVVDLGDTISWDKSHKQLNYLSTKYNLKKLELEKQELSLKARNMQLILAIIVGITLFIILFSLVLFYRKKSKLNYKLHQQDLKLIAANEKIQKANEMKTVFIQNMNHEIRTPLNAIVGFSNYLSEGALLSPEEMQEISKTIKTNSDNLLRLISDMLSIASIDTDSEEPVYTSFPVNACCEELLDDVKEFIHHDTEFKVQLPSEDSVLSSDRKMVQQILFHLLHNAARFTLKGEVELSYRIDTIQKKIIFQVRDTGIGVPKEEQDKIFERFYKVDSFTQGSGLGLSLCRILAKRLNGEVALDKTYQQGALFLFTLPTD